jgi:hypothetical protein
MATKKYDVDEYREEDVAHEESAHEAAELGVAATDK